MASYTAVVTVGPQFPVVYYGFPSREVHDLWFGMVDRARNLATDTVAQRVWPRARTDETVSVYYVVLRSTRRIEMDGRRPPSSRCTWWLTHRVYKVAADKVAKYSTRHI